MLSRKMWNNHAIHISTLWDHPTSENCLSYKHKVRQQLTKTLNFFILLNFHSFLLTLINYFVWHTWSFFFWINKRTRIYKIKGAWKATQSIQEVYKRHLKNRKQKGQTLIDPQQEPNQSTKLNKVKGPTTIEDLAQEKRLQTKEFFNLWIDKTSL